MNASDSVFRGPAIQRRTLFGTCLAGLFPLATVAGCGGGSTEQDKFAEATPKALVSARLYASGTVTSRAIRINSIDLKTVPDRFEEGALCYRFNGGSSAAVADALPDFAVADFAISFWMRCSAVTPLQPLAVGAADGSNALSVLVNQGRAIAVLLASQPAALLATGATGDLADAIWHHILVQRNGSEYQLFVDGMLRARVQVSDGLAARTTLRVGGPWNGDLDDIRLHNRAFNADQVPLMTYAWQSVKPSNYADSMAGYYPFHGNTNNHTGHGVDGVVHNAVPAVNRFGDAGQAYVFNGTDAYIELNDNFDVIVGDFAIGFWLKSSSPGRMIALSATPGHCAIDFVFNHDAGMCLVIDSVPPKTLAFGAPGDFTDNRWHFVLAQRAASILEIYLDGVLRTAVNDATPIFGRGSRVRFGRASDSSVAAPAFWLGLLDDIQVYVRAFTTQEIRDLEGMQFRPRDGAGGLVFGGKLWLLGGWNSEHLPVTNSDVWSSSNGSNWSLAATAPWEGRHTAGHLVFDDKMWVIGGDKNRGHYQNDVWSSGDGVEWRFITATPPWAGRVMPQVLTFENKMWLLGGVKVFELPSEATAYNDVYSSVDGANWTLETAHAGWSPRGLIVGSVVHRGRMWVIGGGQYDVRTFLHDVWSSEDGVRWIQVLENAPWSPRQYHCVAAFHDKIWVIAGVDAESQIRGGTNDVWYSSDGVDWVELKNAPWPARHATSVFERGQNLWLAGGSSTRLFNDVWKLGYAA